MNHARFAEAERSLNAAARKVFDAVPCSEVWSIGQICTELGRLGRRFDTKVVQGCLGQLVELSLVREVDRWHFIRTQPRVVLRAVAPTTTILEEAAMPALTTVQSAPATTSLERLSSIAKSLRDQATFLIAAADAIEDVALDVDAQLASEGRASEQLRQLQALLRGIGVGA